MKASKLLKFIPLAINNKMPILLQGEPGVGKTDVIIRSVETLGHKIHVRHAVCMEPIDFRGFPTIKRGDDKEDTSAEFVPYGDLLDMINATEPTVYFYDDLGQASQSVQKAMMQLFHLREVNGKKISDQIVFIGATNRRADRAGVNGLITPLISRQKSIIKFDCDVDDWIAWAYKNKMPALLIAFIHFRGEELLLNFDPNKVDEDGNELVQQANPRTVAAVGEWLNVGLTLHDDFEVFVGAVGEAFCREFDGFIDVYDKLGEVPNEICDGIDVACPTDPATIYALSSCLAQRMKEDDSRSNIAAWCRSTLPEEFQRLVLYDAEALHKTVITDTIEFVEWQTELRKKEQEDT